MSEESEALAIDCLNAMSAQKKEYERKINELKDALERIMNDSMPLRNLRQVIRPATEAELQPTLQAGNGGEINSVLASGKTAGVFAETLPAPCGHAEGGNAKAALGQAYGLWHRCLPYRIKRFASDREARLFASTYGYQLDGVING